MKKKIILVLCFLLSFQFLTISFAQKIDRKKQTQEDKQKLDEMRKETITFMVNLTDEQAAPFWLIYDEYSKEKGEVEHKLGNLRRLARTQSDTELKKNFEDRFSLREQEVAVERKYFDKFLGVISIRQLQEFYQAEKMLRKKIVKHFRERHQSQKGTKRKGMGKDFDKEE